MIQFVKRFQVNMTIQTVETKHICSHFEQLAVLNTNSLLEPELFTEIHTSNKKLLDNH